MLRVLEIIMLHEVEGKAPQTKGPEVSLQPLLSDRTDDARRVIV